jgi:hypothetical protein
MTPPTPGAPVAPLRPPRRTAPRGSDTGSRGPAEALALSTILAPTRFLHTLPALAAPNGDMLCDGRRTIADVAREAGVEPHLAVDVLSRLYAEGLVRETDRSPVPPVLFLEHARSFCLRYRREKLSRAASLESTLAGGGYSPRLATGYLLEVTHVVRGAAGHIAAAIAHTSDAALQLLLSEYLEDEYWHGAWMEGALRGAGLSDGDIARALPLPATLAVLNSWRYAAHTDLLLYGGLIAITESGPSEGAEIEALFQETVARGVLPEAAWRPYFEHAVGDSAADHLSHGRAIFAAAGPLAQGRREALRQLLLLHTEALVLQENAVLEFYGPAAGPPVYDLPW